MKFRGIVILICIGLLPHLSLGYSADSLGYRALEQDWEGWNEALELHRSDLRPSINGGVWSVFAWPQERRPAWARLSDTAMWVLAVTSAPTWNYATESEWFDLESAAFIELPAPSEKWMWVWWALLAISLGVIVVAVILGSARFYGVPASFGAIDEAIRRKRMSAEASSAWLELQNRMSILEVEVADVDWGDVQLSGTEEEVVAGMLRGWSAEETALKLVCTPSHIYNVRSQIRKKLNLSPNEDLERHIRRRFLRPKR